MSALALPQHRILIGLIVLCCAVEGLLLGADWELWGTASWRTTAYDWGGFWPGLLDNWRPNFDSQPYVMFVSYAVLHGGALHLVMNMITLWSLGQAVIARIGALRFGALYLSTALGGGVGYGLLAETVRPMVGASGALFGLAGALLAWAYVDRFTARIGLWPIAQMALFLLAINLVMFWALNGQLAWQTHLGGFLTGWVVALLIDPRSRAIDPPPPDPGSAAKPETDTAPETAPETPPETAHAEAAPRAPTGTPDR